MEQTGRLKEYFKEFEPHILEIRQRLIKVVVGLVVGIGVSFAVSTQIIGLLTVPVGGIENLQAIEVTESIGVFMRVSIFSGFILSFPFTLYQFAAFIFPGLENVEKKWVLYSIPFATILFLAGVTFTYYFMLPVAVPFLINFMGVATVPRLSNYIDFVTGLMFWVGVVFELPLLSFLLAKLNIISAKGLLKQWRIAIVLIAVLAAVITPTGDPVNMGLLMLPLLVLYFLSVVLAHIARHG